MTFYRFILSVAVILMMSCGNEKKVDPDCSAASEAAEQYYRYLVDGNNADFVSSFVGKDSLPPDYRAALDSNANDFMDVMKERHGGITDVKVCSASKDSINKTINVFLTVCYGDSTSEKVVVPMIKDNDKWLMK